MSISCGTAICNCSRRAYKRRRTHYQLFRSTTKPAEVSASAIANTIDIIRRNTPPEEKNQITDRNKSSANNNKRTIVDTEFEGESIRSIVNYHHKES